MSNYSRGANFERRLVKQLEEWGADVIRSAGSHGVVDVVSALGGIWFAYSVRIGNYWSPIEREQFEGWCKRNKCTGYYVWREQGKIQFKGTN